MSLNVAMNISTPVAGPKPADHAKGATENASRFDEALAGDPGKRRSGNAETRATGTRTQSWENEALAYEIDDDALLTDIELGGGRDDFLTMLDSMSAQDMPDDDADREVIGKALVEDNADASPNFGGSQPDADEDIEMAISSDDATKPEADVPGVENGADRLEDSSALSISTAANIPAAPGGKTTSSNDRDDRRTRQNVPSPPHTMAKAADGTAPDTRLPADTLLPTTGAPRQIDLPTALRGEVTRLFTLADGFQGPAKGAQMPVNGGLTALGDSFAARLNVLNFTTALAPSNPQLFGPTASGLVAAIEAEPTWRSAAAEAALMANQRSASQLAGTSTLRIQLNPAELGMVTARLTATGSQLSIEIQVESNDARQRLANDSEAILKALRGVGFDIEKVTIQQAPQNANGNGQQGGAGDRGQSPFDQQQDNSDAKRQNSQGGSKAENKAGGHVAGDATSNHSGGVYI